jgi:rod shape-determining protein MreC
VIRDRHARRRLLAYGLLVALCLMMLAVSGSRPVTELRNGVRYAVAPIQDFLSQGTDSVTSVLGAIRDVDTLRRDNQELSATVAQLRDQLATMEGVQSEYDKLTRLLKTQNTLKIATVAASVTGLELSQYDRMVTIDRGSESDVREGAPVLSAGGALLGRVTDVGQGWADVMLISDSDFLVAGLDSRTQATGNVSGRLSSPLTMTEIARSDRLAENDLIVTLGANLGKRFRSVYPKGIPIGRVVDIIEEPGSIVKTAILVPEADLEHIEHVLVQTDFKDSVAGNQASAAAGG